METHAAFTALDKVQKRRPNETTLRAVQKFFDVRASA
jgi:hypothetical protein